MQVGNRKVAIIGSGFVGSSVAYALALRDVAREIVLIDINHEKSRGEAKDIRHGIPALGTANLYAGDYQDCKDCELIVITAGRGRLPGETRLDLAAENARIMRSVTTSIMEHYTTGVIMVVSNPVDILTYQASEWTGLPNGMVFGTGCVLDTSRLVRSIADYLSLSTGVINAYVVGEHGDSQVPIWSRATVAGIQLGEYCASVGLPWNEDIRQSIADETRTMGADIIHAKGKTHYGIATCVCHLADAILNARSTIAMVSSPMLGEHGVRDLALSVPSVVGTGGVRQRIRERWDADEYHQFFDAAEKVRAILHEVDDAL
ncbi:MAG: L-lactate dehydrogenase [Coriobacteriales bacterium]|nr:L-lactate dehydrogenase [Coriobacteriales bacterium]